MTLELMAIIVAIVAATITLGGLILAQSRAAERDRAEIRECMSRLEVSMGERMARLEVSLEERVARLEVLMEERVARLEGSWEKRIARLEVSLGERMARLGERMARLEGTLDGLREYFVGSDRDAA